MHVSIFVARSACKEFRRRRLVLGCCGDGSPQPELIYRGGRGGSSVSMPSYSQAFGLASVIHGVCVLDGEEVHAPRRPGDGVRSVR